MKAGTHTNQNAMSPINARMTWQSGSSMRATCPVASACSSSQTVNTVSSDYSGPVCAWAWEQSEPFPHQCIHTHTHSQMLTYQKHTAQKSKHILYKDGHYHSKEGSLMTDQTGGWGIISKSSLEGIY